MFCHSLGFAALFRGSERLYFNRDFVRTLFFLYFQTSVFFFIFLSATQVTEVIPAQALNDLNHQLYSVTRFSAHNIILDGSFHVNSQVVDVPIKFFSHTLLMFVLFCLCFFLPKT